MTGPARPSAAELVREAERVAERLQVVAVRMAARANAEGDRVLANVQEVLIQLADLALEAEGADRRPLPTLAPHGLADQVLVLAQDLARAGDGRALESGLALLLELKRRI